MNKITAPKIMLWFLGIIILILLFFMVKGTLLDKQLPKKFEEEIRHVSGFTYEIAGGASGEIDLPHHFNNLPPRTPVTLTTELVLKRNETLLLKTIYSPLRLYADDVLIYECGQEGSYPAFLLDPPTILTFLELPEKDTPQKLRFEYLSPAQRDILTIPTILAGNDLALITSFAKQNSFTFIYSLFQIFIGVVLVLVALLLKRTESSFSSFLWLGLFSTSTGIWSFAECNLTAFLIPYPSLLYILAFAGLFISTIPLLQFTLSALKLHDTLALKITLFAFIAAVTSAFTLQLFSLVGLSRSMYLFHTMISIALIVIVKTILQEYLRHRNRKALYFFIPMLILAVSVMLEVINYQFRFIQIMPLFIQVGVFLFVLSLGIIGGFYTRKAMRTAVEKNRLEFKVSLISRQLEVEKRQYGMLTKNAEAVNAQRHDLRHQLAVIRQYNDTNDNEKLRGYLDELIAKIPTEKELRLCENFAVNAVVTYYLFFAKNEGIEVTTNLVIPSVCGRVLDSDLCVIMGNIFENALEACKQMNAGSRFIHLRSRVQYDTLIITMDNSFDGLCHKNDDRFISSKSGNKGIGIASVQSVAERYDGAVRFEVKDEVFLSSVYVKMGSRVYR